MLSGKSYAKINLFLYILRKREDGYHEIATLFAKVGLHDSIKIEKSDSTVLQCNDSGIPTDEGNIILKVFNILRKEYGVEGNLKITLQKEIPFGAGLGGGSSNAECFLRLADEFFSLGLTIEQKSSILAAVGSDTVFFMYDKPMLGTGRGEILNEGPKLPKMPVLLVNPCIHVSAGEIYSHPNLKLTPEFDIGTIRHAYDFGEAIRLLYNGMEEAVFGLHPEVMALRDKILKLGAKGSMMSGSGSTVFGIFDDEIKMEQAAKEIHISRPDYKIYKTFIRN